MHFVLVLICVLVTSEAARNGPLRREIEVLEASQVRSRVFSGDISWVLFFHHGPCYACVYKWLDIIAFATWMKGKTLFKIKKTFYESD